MLLVCGNKVFLCNAGLLPAFRMFSVLVLDNLTKYSEVG